MVNSKKLLAISFLISVIVFASASRASDQLLATFSTDVSGETFQLTTTTTKENQTLTSFKINKIISDISIKNKEIPIDDFLRDGLSVYQKGIHNLTKIYSHNFSEQDGGRIVLESYETSSQNIKKIYQLELSKEQTKWSLIYKGHPITKIHAILGVTGKLDLVME
jgi:uncharacterized protein YoxC